MSSNCSPVRIGAPIHALADSDGLCPGTPTMRRAGEVRHDPAPPPILGIECTQAIQRLDLTGRRRPVPLIAGKDLLLRVYLSPRAEDWESGSVPKAVVAALEADGRAIPGLFVGGPLSPKDGVGSRGDAASTLNIAVPGAACQGTVAFGLTLTTPPSARKKGTLLARHSLSVDFLPVPRIPVDLVPIEFELEDAAGKKTTTPAPVLPDAWRPLEDVTCFFPTPGVAVRTWMAPQSLSSKEERGFRDAIRVLMKCDLAKTTEGILIGVIDERLRGGPAPVEGLSESGVALLIDGSAHLVAHEVGHILGRLHSPGGIQNAVDPDYPDVWPNPPGNLDDFGFSAASTSNGTVEFSVPDPTTSADYMGALGLPNPWTSAYGYERTLAPLRRCGWRRRGGCRNLLLLDVEITGPSEARLHPSYRIEGRPPGPLGRETAFTVEQLDRHGAIVRRHTLHEVAAGTGGDPGSQADHLPRFIEAVPWHPATRALSISRNGGLIDRRELGPAPRLGDVSIDFRGERTVELSWTLDDEENVAHLIRFSDDGGTTWHVVAIDHGSTRLVVDLAGYPGGERCQFEISASRRAATATVRSEVFSVDPVRASPWILRPSAGRDRFSTDDIVVLSGWAFSPDEPAVADGRFRWEARAGSKILPLGIGRRILVRGASLPRGEVSITLEVNGASVDFPITISTPERGRESGSR